MPDLHGPWDGSAFGQSQWYRDTGHKSGVLGAQAPAASPGSGELSLTAAGFTLSLGLGRARVRGAAYERTGTAWTDTVNANTSSVGPRIDRVVLRRDLTAKTVVPVRVQGTAAATPTPPALTRVENGIWDLPLFQVTVPANSGTPLVIADERLWAATDRTIAEGYLSGPGGSLLINASPTWDTISSTGSPLGVTDGGLVICRWSIAAFNGQSGADRTMSVQVICDGAQVGSVLGITIPILNTRTINRVGAFTHTPGPGLHQWYLQAQANTASSVLVDTASLIIVEKV